MNTNPMTQFRLDHFLSQDGMADICNVTRQTIQGVENGIFETIPPSVINGLREEFDIAEQQLQSGYGMWIKEQLNAINVMPIVTITRTSAIGEPDKVESRIPVGIKTFREWRRALCLANGYSDTVSGFSKLIKIQPVIIRKYETHRTKSFPAALATRLRFWGFPESYLSELAGLSIGKAA